ncbi:MULTISPECIES: Gfo/Idh/MocA family protein [unclassified Imperialibacter]|uniref:Gfo/Idh/MocA family protein n=1 Tax=unclassified Imperialibacter TaxID=2629706 RepID=UPI00125659FD|nr:MULTISPECIES: Gfo/Idh/MocA family oxidoreductase [unclassified Imperialibacter]CAD5253847.1 Gfo/Idh/MocA family oxidoreductase [Imperialibacter sp. 89]CAD5275268.1 Gfo/Idh/MocA family oxidoreductase [Imperialibacter sp. 75]VVT19602.1 Oxidoreductase [Imperialibacter sp. EC-SDR9]
MEKIRVGVVGSGKAACMHADGIVNIKNASLVAVHSRSKERGEAFAGKYGAKAYQDIADMVAAEKLDMVTVCSPHPNHLEAVEAAMSEGSHVLVEKPLASTLEDCDAMIAASKKYGKKLGMVSQRRILPASQRIRKAIDAGKIGSPALGIAQLLGWRGEDYYKGDPWRGSWEHEGGGVLVNQAPHQIDLLQWYMGGEMESLYGVWNNINHPYIEVDDTAVAIIKFKGGGIANLILSNSQKPGLYGKVHIHGSNGASVGVQTDGGAMFIAGISKVQEPPKTDLWTVPGEESLVAQWEKEDVDLFHSEDPIEYFIRAQNQDFVDAIINDRPPMVDGEEGRKTVEIFTAIYRSMETGKEIKWPL